jgi:hypothetical protein
MIHEVVNKALKLWVEATGHDPNESTFNFINDVYKKNRAIQESQKLDPGVLTTFMVLRSSVREYAAEQSFDALELLEDPDAILKRTAKLRELLKLLNDSEGTKLVQEWQKKLKKAAKEYGLGNFVDELIEDPQDLAYIRRDALRAMKELKVHHFSRGRRGDKKAKYNGKLLKFWNMASVIGFAQVQKIDGVTMVLIRDPVAEYSFFGFLIRNGENITFLTDVEPQTHPLQKYMKRSRGKGRAFESRAYQLRFPYQLFDFKFTDKGEYVEELGGTKSLVPVNIKAALVCEIKDLEPDQALWSMMMFDIIQQRYWRERRRRDKLSYTGSGTVMLPEATSSNKGALVAAGHAPVPYLTRKEINRDALKKNWKRKPTGQHYWMEDRYAHLVPDQAFNLVGEGKKLLLTTGEKVTDKGLLPMIRSREGELQSVDASAFGTPLEMEKDRRFLARHNQAVIIQKEAKKEYTRRVKKIRVWYEKKVRQNLDALMEFACKGKMMSEIQGAPPKKHKDDFEHVFENGIPKPGNILHVCIDKSPPSWWRREAVCLYSMREIGDYGRQIYSCFISKMNATVWAHFTPKTPVSLSHMANVPVKELPDVLQHWYQTERYDGNCILDRIDPLEWKCKNPWMEETFEVVIGLSKRQFNRECKKRGLPILNLKEKREE